MALSHVMIHQAVMRHLFILCARTAVVGIRIDADASAWGKDSRDLDVLGVHQLDEILHDGVDTILNFGYSALIICKWTFSTP